VQDCYLIALVHMVHQASTAPPTRESATVRAPFLLSRFAAAATIARAQCRLCGIYIIAVMRREGVVRGRSQRVPVSLHVAGASQAAACSLT
jgi:hypothetical protein